jgi:hypothetical protein
MTRPMFLRSAPSGSTCQNTTGGSSSRTGYMRCKRERTVECRRSSTWSTAT